MNPNSRKRKVTFQCYISYSVGLGFSNRGKGLELLFFFVLVPNFETNLWGVAMKPIVAQPNVGSGFVLWRASSALTSHAAFQGNSEDGWTKDVLVRAYFHATPLLHPFTTFRLKKMKAI